MRCATVTGVTTGGIPAILSAQAGSGGSALVAQETGQFSSSGTIVWLRVTDDGSVLVFAARGFRSAFAHPSVLTGDETERWARLFTAFLGVDSAAQADRDPSGSLRARDTTTVHGVFADGDVTVQQQMVGQALALVMRYGARGPAPVTATYPALALNAIIPTLHRTAQLAKAIAAAHQAAAAAAVTAAPAIPAATAPPAPAPANDRPEPPAPSAAPAAPRASEASTAAATRATPTNVVVPVALPASSQPASPPASKERPTTSQPLAHAPSNLGGSSSPQIGYVVDPPDSRIQYTAAPGPLSTSGASTKGPSTAASRGADSTAGDSVAEKALSSEGRLSPAVLGDVIRQRQQLLQYCYTEFGLHGDAALAGQIVVRLVIQQNGTVSEVTVPQHHWSGRGADKVESCIRDRVLLWEFPAAQRASTHEIQLIFGR